MKRPFIDSILREVKLEIFHKDGGAPFPSLVLEFGPWPEKSTRTQGDNRRRGVDLDRLGPVIRADVKPIGASGTRFRTCRASCGLTPPGGNPATGFTQK